MFDILPEETERFVRAAIPEPDPVVQEMEAYGREHGPPTVGREVGQFLHLLTHLTGARRVFEFGSGYGYSGYWFASALSGDGTVVLTEHDEDELELAREYFEQANLTAQAEFEVGDAFDAVDRYDGPFDIVLVDHQKARYADALDAIEGKLADGGLVIADNAMVATPIEFEPLLKILEGENVSVNEETRGVADYLLRVRDSSNYETSVVPLGEGISVSYKIP